MLRTLLSIAIAVSIFNSNIFCQSTSKLDNELYLDVIYQILQDQFPNTKPENIGKIAYDISNKLYFRNDVSRTIDSLIQINSHLIVNYNDTITLHVGTQLPYLSKNVPNTFRIIEVPEKRYDDDYAIYFSPLARDSRTKDKYYISCRMRSYAEEQAVVYSLIISDNKIREIEVAHYELYVF